MFKHYILTKFNVGIYNRKHADEWMAHRVDLFEKYTYPSVMNQTVKDFTWLVLFDKRTPEDVYKKYDLVPVLTTYIEHIRKADTEWIITSRIDSDDYYHPQFIEKVQGCFTHAELAVDTYGEKYYVNTGEFGRASSQKGSSFISLIEKLEGAKTVRQSHRFIPTKYPTKMITEKLYVQVIHDKNVLNG